jgi:hypothetical protein
MTHELAACLELPKCSLEIEEPGVVSCSVEKYRNESVHCGQKNIITSDTERRQRVKSSQSRESEFPNQNNFDLRG